MSNTDSSGRDRKNCAKSRRPQLKHLACPDDTFWRVRTCAAFCGIFYVASIGMFRLWSVLTICAEVMATDIGRSRFRQTSVQELTRHRAQHTILRQKTISYAQGANMKCVAKAMSYRVEGGSEA